MFGILILLKFFGLLVFFPCIVNACPNWQATFENSQLVGWDYQLNPQNIKVVHDPQDENSQVIKLTITESSIWPNGHTRTEVKHNGCKTNEGESTFLSWEFYLDKPITTRNNIAYWETDKTYQQSMGLYLQPNPDNDKNTSQLTFFSNLTTHKTHWQDTVKVGEWNKISLAITWSQSEQNGHISLWVNDQPVLAQQAVQTKPDANELFIQLGLHRNQAEATIDSIYLRNIKEVANLEQLLKR
jgi:hypothetical protein